MFRSLMLKELREAWWIGLLPFAAMVYAMAGEVRFGRIAMTGALGFKRLGEPHVMHPMPFLHGTFSTSTLFWAGTLAVGLGLWQTFRESHSRTWHFLLHRPVSRQLILNAKMASAAVVYLYAVVLPAVVLCVWAATPGTHASPFSWLLTAPVWLAIVAALSLYLGALFAGLRRGSMIGFRWWPLVGTAIVIGATFVAIETHTPLWIWALILGWEAVMVAAVMNEMNGTDFN